MISNSFANMRIKYSYITLSIVIGFFCAVPYASAVVDNIIERQVEVSIRTIGHEVMLAHGDSISRILPVEQDGDLYRIRFDTEFQFSGSKVITAVDDVVKRTNLAHHYLVQIQDEETKEIIYSYEVDGTVDFNNIPCGSRDQPVASYNLLLSILDDTGALFAQNKSGKSSELSAIGSSSMMLLAIPFVLLLGIGLYINKNKSTPASNPHIIHIGNYQFDKRNMKLSLADKDIELTSKESDLLILLRSSANTTIERDDILRHVWGDQGDYVGRTLDVFISKLRKKLEGDPGVKITNIRGVGYRLVVNEI